MALLLVLCCTPPLLLPGVARADDAPIATGRNSSGKVRVEILSLKRTEGDTVTLRFALVNDGRENVHLTLPNMTLLDLVNRRRFSTGVTSTSCRAANGERQICWAMFAAPNPNVRSLNVMFFEDFDLIPVPISD